MSLRAILLGCGTSSGVPRIGGDWGACDPSDPRNARSRASIVIETATTRILVDTSPDMRAQLLAAEIADVDAIFWTHDHADHAHGIDDVRQLMHRRGTPVPGLARPQTLKLLKRRFAYAFEGREGYRPIIEGATIEGEAGGAFDWGDVAVRWTDMPHGAIFSTGFRFDHDGRSIGYMTDFHVVTPEMMALMADLDVLVIDVLRDKPHPTHPHLGMVLEAVAQTRPRRTVLTHMDQSMDYAALSARLPAGVEPGADGLELAA